MTFLPIVQRELLVAAKRRATFRMRWGVALIAALIAGVSTLVLWAFSGPSALGAAVFHNLSACAFGVCLLAGAFLTADSLSAEKRDGTLGFLFLTELHGYDVVLGKFTAILLGAAYALLAIVPVTGLPLLLGGVTGGEFWRMALALLNALFFSLSVGIWISSFSLDGQKAIGRALGLVLASSFLGPMLARWAPTSSPWVWVTWASPYWPFADAFAQGYAAHSTRYWASLGVNQALAWFLLGWSCVLLPFSWQEREPRSRWWRGVVRQVSTTRGRARGVVGSGHPVAWLLDDQPRLAWWLWGIVVVQTGAIVVASLQSPQAMLMSTVGSVWLFGFALRALLAFQVCRFFAEARRTGALELLLATPLRNEDLLEGHDRFLRKYFFLPIATFLGVTVLGPVAVTLANSWLNGSVPAYWNAAGTSVVGLITSGFAAISMVLDVFAVIWFGRWISLTGRRPGYAAGVTILVVLILARMLPCGLSWVADVVIIAVCRGKLQEDLRALVGRQYEVRAAQ